MEEVGDILKDIGKTKTKTNTRKQSYVNQT